MYKKAFGILALTMLVLIAMLTNVQACEDCVPKNGHDHAYYVDAHIAEMHMQAFIAYEQFFQENGMLLLTLEAFELRLQEQFRGASLEDVDFFFVCESVIEEQLAQLAINPRPISLLESFDFDYFESFDFDYIERQRQPFCNVHNWHTINPQLLIRHGGPDANFCEWGYAYRFIGCRNCAMTDWIWLGPYTASHIWTQTGSLRIDHGPVHPGNCRMVSTTWDRCAWCPSTRNFRTESSLFWCVNPGIQPTACYEDE